MTPVLLLIGLGYILAKLRQLPRNSEEVLLDILFKISIPALVFETSLEEKINYTLNLHFMLAYFLTIVTVILLTMVIFNIAKVKNFKKLILMGMNSALSSSSLISLPILLKLFGNKSTIPISLMLIVSLILIMPMLIFALEYSSKALNRKKTLLKSLKKTLLTPFVLAFSLAFLLKKTSILIPSVFLTTTHYLGDLTTPCALLAIGMQLEKSSTSIINKEITTLVSISLVVKSLFSMILVYYFHLPTIFAASLVVVSAAPTTSTVLMIANKYRVYQQETSSIIFLTTLLSAISIPTCLIILNHFNIIFTK